MARPYHVFRSGTGVEPFKRVDAASGQTVNRRFRFNITAGMQFEDELGCGINQLLTSGRSLSAIVHGLLFGFRWEDPKLTKDRVAGDLQIFCDQGGDIAEIHGQLIDAINEGGAYGRRREAPSVDPPAAGADGEAGSASATSEPTAP